MSPSKDPVTPYASSCNPPRRAKRPRTESEAADPSSSATSQPRLRPQLLPKEPQNGQVDNSPYRDSSDDEDEYDPVVASPAPKRRGRKPGPMSRSARESQRKLNHSRIEKARRTKINETLATLSNLVSEAEKERGAADPSRVPVEPVGKDKGEKEFKLDVLVKTVTYIQELIQRVKTLEEQKSSAEGDSRVNQGVAGTKRKHRTDEDEEDEIEIIETSSASHCNTFIDVTSSNTARRSSVSRATPRPPGQSPCLPPISAWLPHPYIDPSYLNESNMLPSANQLPTPPLSGSFRTPLSLTSQVLPALSLPGPAHPMMSHPSSPESTKSMRVPMPPSRRQSNASTVGRSPPVSPTWTPEDETAASLLLQMSSSPVSSISSSSAVASTPTTQAQNLETARAVNRRPTTHSYPMQAETPSSLLGLSRAA